MIGINTYFEYYYLNAPPPFYLTPQMPKLFIPPIEKLRPRGKKTCPGHIVGPQLRQTWDPGVMPLGFLASPNFQ